MSYIYFYVSISIFFLVFFLNFAILSYLSSETCEIFEYHP